jgi:hypothetical protein
MINIKTNNPPGEQLVQKYNKQISLKHQYFMEYVTQKPAS